MPAPNLIISDLEVGNQTLAPGAFLSRSIAAGSSFTITIDIKNIGDRSASSSTAAVFLRDVSGNEVRMDTNSTNSLSAGRTDPNEDLTVTVPANYAPGTYMVIVRADYRDQVRNESNEADNFRIFLINVTGGPPDSVREGTDTRDSLTEGRWRSDAIEAEPIAGDGVVSDRVGGFIDKDWYEVTLSANRTYSFEAESVSLSTGRVFIRLYNSAGNEVSTATAAEGASPRFSYSTAGQSGSQTFYVAVGAGDTNGADFRTATGDYRVRFNDEGAVAGDSVREGTDTRDSLTEGRWRSGAIEAEPIAGDGVVSDRVGGFIDKDWYEVTLSANRTYSFEAESVSLSTGRVFIRLYNSAGNEVSTATAAEGASPRFSYSTAGQSGSQTFYVAVGAGDTNGADFRTATGDYRVRFNDEGAVAGDSVLWGIGTTHELFPNEVVVSSIEQDGANGPNTRIDKDWFKVVLEGGQTYTFNGSANVSTADSLDAIAMRLYLDNSTRVSSLVEGAEPSLVFNAPGTGSTTYYLAISAGGNGNWMDDTGSYQVSFVSNGTTRVENRAPLAQANDVAVPVGTSIALSDLFSFRDLDGSSDIVSFAVQDRTSGGGYLTYRNEIQPHNVLFQRPIEELGDWKFVSGARSDKIGFNAIDRAGLFNSSVIATVSVAEAESTPLSSEELFERAGGKYSSLALFASAAYEKNYESMSDLYRIGWRILDDTSGLPGFSGNHFYNASEFDPLAGIATAILAESPDGKSLVVAFKGTDIGLSGDALLDWLNNVTGITKHYELFESLLSAIDFSRYENIYVTGHSLGGAMTQALMLDPTFGFTSDPRVEGVAFANPGYVIPPTSLNENRIVSILLDGDPVAELGQFGRISGDRYVVDHLLPPSFDFHSMNWYIAAAEYIDKGFARSIDLQLSNGRRDLQELKVALQIRDGNPWIGNLPSGTAVSPDNVVFGSDPAITGPAQDWSVSIRPSTAQSTAAVIYDSPQFTNVDLLVTKSNSGVVVIKDAVGTVQLAASYFSELILNAPRRAKSIFKFESLQGTSISENTVYFSGGDMADVVDALLINRRLVADAGPGDDSLIGGSRGDHLHGGTGDDTMLGGAGNDIYFVDSAGDQVYETTSVTATTDAGGLDTVHSEIDFSLLAHRGVQFVENLVLEGTGNLQGIGNALANSLTGNSGHNVLRGAAGNDTLWGGDGNDTLDGGEGRDRLDGGAGSNVLRGGAGDDRYVIRSAEDRIVDEIGFSQGGGIDTVESWVSFTLPTNVEILRLQGEADLAGTGNAAPGALVGNVGRNQLDGAGGNDVLNGKSGDDRLIGGLGADSLVGEAGRDVFVIRSVAESRPGQGNRDFINGFARGQDLIDLSGIDANALTAQDDAFAFIGSAAFSGVAGQLRYFSFGGGNFCIVEGDTNGDRVADMQIFVNQRSSMVQEDFVL